MGIGAVVQRSGDPPTCAGSAVPGVASRVAGRAGDVVPRVHATSSGHHLGGKAPSASEPEYTTDEPGDASAVSRH